MKLELIFILLFFSPLALCHEIEFPLSNSTICHRAGDYNFESFEERTPWPTTHFMSSFTLCMATQQPMLTFFFAFCWEAVEQLLLIIFHGEYGVFVGDSADLQPESCTDSILGDMGQSVWGIAVATVFVLSFNVPIWVLPYKVHVRHGRMHWWGVRFILVAILLVPFMFSGVDYVTDSGFPINLTHLVMTVMYPVIILIFASLYKIYMKEAYRFFWGKDNSTHYWVLHTFWGLAGSIMISSALYPVISVYYLTWIHATLLMLGMMVLGYFLNLLSLQSLVLIFTQSSTVFDANVGETGFPVNQEAKKIKEFIHTVRRR